MRKGLSVKDIADRLGAAEPNADRARLVEQLRYWTRLDLLAPVGPKHGGSGRWRTYSGASIYVAAVLQELSRYRVAVPVMQLVASTIRLGLEGDEGQLAAAATGNRSALFYAGRLLEALEGRSDIYLSIYAAGPDGEPAIDLAYAPLDANGPGGSAHSAVVVNLTRLFAAMR